MMTSLQAENAMDSFDAHDNARIISSWGLRALAQSWEAREGV